jgi:hypothetical protein
VPLVVAADGTRLAKRAARVTVRDRRDAGERPEPLLAELAALLGLPDVRSPADFAARFDRTTLRGRREIRLAAG